MERARRSLTGDACPHPWRALARSLWKQVLGQLKRSVADWAGSTTPDAGMPAPGAPLIGIEPPVSPLGAPAPTAPPVIAAATPPPVGTPVPTPPAVVPVTVTPSTSDAPRSGLVAPAHLRILMGAATTDIARLRAEVQRRDDDVERLKSALSLVLGRFADLAGRHRTPPFAVVRGTDPAEAAEPAPADVAVRLIDAVVPPADEDRQPEGSAVQPPRPGETGARAPTAPTESRAEDRSECGEIQAAATTIASRPATGFTLVTVILTTVDWPEELTVALRSVLAQAYTWWELIVVDDRRPTTPPSLPDGDGRVRVVLGPGTGTAAAARRGLEAASGRLVTYLDERSVMATDWLGALACAANQSPDSDVFVGRSATVTASGWPRVSMAPESVGTLTGLASDLARLCREGRVVLDPEQSEAHAPFGLGHRWPGTWSPFGPGGDGGVTTRMTPARLATVRRLPLLASIREVTPKIGSRADHAGGTPLGGLTLVGP